MVPTYPKKGKEIIDERQLNLEDFNKPTHFLQDNVENNAIIEYFFFIISCLFTNFVKGPLT